MRAFIFRKILRMLEKHTVKPFIWLEIWILHGITRRGLGDRSDVKPGGMPGSGALCGDKALREYAFFTMDCMAHGADKEARRRLFREAYRVGDLIRRITGFHEQEDLEDLIFWLYSNIKIDMDGHLPGKICVSGCYFSQFYSPEQCAVMSSLDSGIIAGIFGGGRLIFTERITEGCGACRACFRNKPGAVKKETSGNKGN